MVIFTARLRALPGKEDEAADALAAMCDAVEAKESGALAYVCHRVSGSADQFLFYEAYADRDAAEAHGQTPHFQQLGTLMGSVLDEQYGAVIEDLEKVAGFWR